MRVGEMTGDHWLVYWEERCKLLGCKNTGPETRTRDQATSSQTSKRLQQNRRIREITRDKCRCCGKGRGVSGTVHHNSCEKISSALVAGFVFVSGPFLESPYNPPSASSGNSVVDPLCLEYVSSSGVRVDFFFFDFRLLDPDEDE